MTGKDGIGEKVKREGCLRRNEGWGERKRLGRMGKGRGKEGGWVDGWVGQ